MEQIVEQAGHKTLWTLRKYATENAYREGKHYAVAEINGNLLLNEGIGEFIDLLCGIGGTAFSEGHAYIGVGDSDIAAAAIQTALQAAANKAYAPMVAGYPVRVNQTVTFRAVFAAEAANFDWKEFTVINAATDTGKNLNRRVSSQGTKTAGQVWSVDVAITFS
jgi:hypothetical protein